MLNLAHIAEIAYNPNSRNPLVLSQQTGRAGEIRTHDLLHPMQAFYQAELQPDLVLTSRQRCRFGVATVDEWLILEQRLLNATRYSLLES